MHTIYYISIHMHTCNIYIYIYIYIYVLFVIYNIYYIYIYMYICNIYIYIYIYIFNIANKARLHTRNEIHLKNTPGSGSDVLRCVTVRDLLRR